jgi:hypothetical protein
MPVQFVIGDSVAGSLLYHIIGYIVVSALMPVQFVIRDSVNGTL